MLTKVFGPPGTGKTTHLLGVVEKKLEQKVNPRHIGYFAFTRKASYEARDRGIARFPDLRAESDFPWFRTLHSLAYQCIGAQPKDMMTGKDYAEFAKLVGLEVSVSSEGEEFVLYTGNQILNEINLARIRGVDLHTHYNHSDLKLEWFKFEYIERSYRKFKESRMLMDFTDLLERIVEQPERLPTLDCLIVDEAQDLSRLQWKLVMLLSDRAQQTYVAGDDDQAIYVWSGADVDTFLSTAGEVIVLNRSYRIPAAVHRIAERVVHRIKNRQEKHWSPREEEGEVKYYNSFLDVDVTQGEWLIMASTNYMLNDIHTWLQSQGLLFERHGHKSVSDNMMMAVVGWERLRSGKAINHTMLKQVYKHLGPDAIKRGHRALKDTDPDAMYTMEMLREHHGLQTDVIWHEALTKIGEDRRDYLRAVLRRGYKMNAKPDISLSTIHGAKGGEADNVLLLMDLSPKFASEYARNADEINRLLYVGITRTRKTLHLIRPKKEDTGFRI